MLRHSLSQTIEAYPSGEFSTYNIVNGTLLANNDGTPGPAAVSFDIGRPVSFEIGSTDGALIHCAFVRTRSSSYIYHFPSTILIPLPSTLDQQFGWWRQSESDTWHLRGHRQLLTVHCTELDVWAAH